MSSASIPGPPERIIWPPSRTLRFVFHRNVGAIFILWNASDPRVILDYGHHKDNGDNPGLGWSDGLMRLLYMVGTR